MRHNIFVMGFRNYNLGSFLPVEADGDIIRIWFNTGCEEYKTKLNMHIPKQVNEFYLENVLFMLYTDEARYVGRADGTIAGYSLTDNAIVRLTTWETPPRPRLENIGGSYYYAPVVARLDRTRNRVVYIGKSTDEYVFDKPFTSEVFLPEGLTGCFTEHFRSMNITTIDGSEVNLDEAGHWCLQAPFQRSYPRGIF